MPKLALSVNIAPSWREDIEVAAGGTRGEFDVRLKQQLSDFIGGSTDSLTFWQDGVNVPMEEVAQTLFHAAPDETVHCEVRLGPNAGHPMHDAAMLGQIQAIMSWAAAGADIDLPNPQGYTPLHYASGFVLSVQPAVVEFLLRCGADVHSGAEAGFTPLHYAAIRAASARDAVPGMEAVKALLAAGADPRQPARDGRSAIELAEFTFRYPPTPQPISTRDSLMALLRGAPSSLAPTAPDALPAAATPPLPIPAPAPGALPHMAPGL